MRELVTAVITQLEHGDTATLQSAAPLALYLVERARGLPAFSPLPDWPHGIEEVLLSPDELDELRDSLLRIVATAPPQPGRTGVRQHDVVRRHAARGESAARH